MNAQARNLSKSDVSGQRYFYEQVVSKLAFCESTSESACFAAWKQRTHEYYDYLNQKARLVTDALEPAEVVAILLFAIVSAACMCACGLAYRRRLRRHLQKLEAELDAMRLAKERARGGEDTAALVIEYL